MQRNKWAGRYSGIMALCLGVLCALFVAGCNTNNPMPPKDTDASTGAMTSMEPVKEARLKEIETALRLLRENEVNYHCEAEYRDFRNFHGAEYEWAYSYSIDLDHDKEYYFNIKTEGEDPEEVYLFLNENHNILMYAVYDNNIVDPWYPIQSNGYDDDDYDVFDAITELGSPWNCQNMIFVKDIEEAIDYSYEELANIIFHSEYDPETQTYSGADGGYSFRIRFSEGKIESYSVFYTISSEDVENIHTIQVNLAFSQYGTTHVTLPET